jgi:hypothetical protein
MMKKIAMAALIAAALVACGKKEEAMAPVAEVASAATQAASAVTDAASGAAAAVGDAVKAAASAAK